MLISITESFSRLVMANSIVFHCRTSADVLRNLFLVLRLMFFTLCGTGKVGIDKKETANSLNTNITALLTFCT